ncbi:hypothetical protein VCV18_005669 [Metarhizium anisopliae]
MVAIASIIGGMYILITNRHQVAVSYTTEPLARLLVGSVSTIRSLCSSDMKLFRNVLRQWALFKEGGLAYNANISLFT